MHTKVRTKKDLRIFAIGILIIAGALAGLFYYKESFTTAAVLTGFSFYGLFAIAFPIVITPLYIVFTLLGLVLGWVNTRVLLGLIFLVAFTPLGLLFRLIGRDPLKRKLDRQAASYWTRVGDEPYDRTHYERQY